MRVVWLDASEASGGLPAAEGGFDTPVWSYGIFLGVKGTRARSVVVAKEVVLQERVFHYNVIPIAMVDEVVLLRRGDLDPTVLEELTRKVEGTPVKRFKTGSKGGWMRWG